MRTLVIFAFLLAISLAVINGAKAEPEVYMASVDPSTVDNQLDEEVNFQGDCSICQDPEEFAYFYWNSSIDEILSEGTDLSGVNFERLSSEFTKGEHEMTLQVKDTGGDWSTIDDESTAILTVNGKDDNTGGSITVNFEIMPPMISLGETVAFTACKEMLEPQPCVDDPDIVLAFDWDIMLEGDDSEWLDLCSMERCETRGLNILIVGEHQVRLTITNVDTNETAEGDAVQFIVNPPVPSAIIGNSDPNYFLKEEQNLSLTARCLNYMNEEINCTYEWELRKAQGSDLVDTFEGSDIVVSGMTNQVFQYIIKLRTKDDNNTDSAWTTAMITVNPVNKLPIAFIDIYPDSLGGMTPEYYNYTELTFDSSKSADSDGNIVSYEWLFNNEVVSQDATWTVTFEELGFKNVKLKVFDNDGAASAKVTTNVKIIENTPPSVNISIEYSNGNYYLNSTASDLEGPIVEYQWFVEYPLADANGNKSLQWISLSRWLMTEQEFNDGLILSHFNITWDGKDNSGVSGNLLVPGIYKVKLVATDGGNQSTTVESKLVVESMEQKSFVATFSAKEIEIGDSVTINFAGTMGSVDYYKITVNYPDKTIKVYETKDETYTVKFNEAGTYGLDAEVIWTDGIAQDNLADWYGRTIIVGGGDTDDSEKTDLEIPSEDELPSVSILVTLMVVSLIATIRRQR